MLQSIAPDEVEVDSIKFYASGGTLVDVNFSNCLSPHFDK